MLTIVSLFNKQFMAFRAKWQFMDRNVTRNILYGSKRSWSPYTILRVTTRSIHFHMARSDMNYLIYYTQSVRRHVVYYCISKTKEKFGQNPEENIIWTGPCLYTVILTGSLTKTNRENINVKYNILPYDGLVYYPLSEIKLITHNVQDYNVPFDLGYSIICEFRHFTNSWKNTCMAASFRWEKGFGSMKLE
jgi:hypothetical protein